MKKLLILVIALVAIASLVSMVRAPRDHIYVELYANASQGNTVAFREIASNGKISPDDWVLPPEMVLVVSDVLITPNVSDGVFAGNLNNMPTGLPGSSENRIRFQMDTSQQRMLHLPLSTGLLFTNEPNVFAFATNPGALVMRLVGHVKRG